MKKNKVKKKIKNNNISIPLAQGDGTYGYLRKNSACVGFPADEGKLLYEFSIFRAEYDFSTRKRRAVMRSGFGLVLPVMAGLLVTWFFVSVIYGLCTQSASSVIRVHLPSLAVTAVAVAILLISFFGAWGSLVRWTSSRGTAKGKTATGVDRPQETAICVTERYLILYLLGNKYVFLRDECCAQVAKTEGSLKLRIVFGTGNRADELDFPLRLPLEDFSSLKKVFREKLTVQKNDRFTAEDRDDKGRRLYGGYTLGNVVVSAIISLLMLSAGVTLATLSIRGIIPVPVFVGIFFVGGGLLALCNTFHHVPFVRAAGLPFVFGLILVVVPLWALFWIEEQMNGNPLSFIGLITHATPEAVGFVFLAMMGIYAIAYALTKIVYLVRFGAEI